MASITKKNNVNYRCLSVLMLGSILVGCEASLNLEGVAQEMDKPIRRTDQFQGVASNGSTIVAVGSDGLIVTSAVDDLTWNRKDIEGSPSFVDVDSCNDNTFVALSIDKRIWISDPQGEHWLPTELPTPEDMVDVSCSPENDIWTVGSFSTVLHSSDKGKSWTESTLNEDALLTSIQFLDAQTVLVSGEFGVLSKTTDGGITWSAPEYIPDGFYVQSAFFKSINEGWVAGLSGKILYTNDGGLTWNTQVTSTESPLYGFIESNNRIFAYGDHSTILELSGERWQSIPNAQSPVYIRAALQLTKSTLLMTGGSGALYTLDVPFRDMKISQQ